MPIKIFGAILIITAGSVYGFSRAEKLAKRERSLIALKTAFRILESEISFTSSHLKHAFLHIHNIMKCGKLFELAAMNIELTGISSAWCEAVEKEKKALCLTDKDAEILKTLASELGHSDREHQTKNINHVSALLSQAIEDAHNEYTTSAKLYRNMGILGGIFIVLILF